MDDMSLYTTAEEEMQMRQTLLAGVSPHEAAALGLGSWVDVPYAADSQSRFEIVPYPSSSSHFPVAQAIDLQPEYDPYLPANIAQTPDTTGDTWYSYPSDVAYVPPAYPHDFIGDFNNTFPTPETTHFSTHYTPLPFIANNEAYANQADESAKTSHALDGPTVRLHERGPGVEARMEVFVPRGIAGELRQPKVPWTGWTPRAAADAGLTYSKTIVNAQTVIQVSWHDPTLTTDHYVVSSGRNFSDAQLVCAVRRCGATLDLSSVPDYKTTLKWKYGNSEGTASPQLRLNCTSEGQEKLFVRVPVKEGKWTPRHDAKASDCMLSAPSGSAGE